MRVSTWCRGAQGRQWRLESEGRRAGPLARNFWYSWELWQLVCPEPWWPGCTEISGVARLEWCSAPVRVGVILCAAAWTAWWSGFHGEAVAAVGVGGCRCYRESLCRPGVQLWILCFSLGAEKRLCIMVGILKQETMPSFCQWLIPTYFTQFWFRNKMFITELYKHHLVYLSGQRHK